MNRLMTFWASSAPRAPTHAQNTQTPKHPGSQTGGPLKMLSMRLETPGKRWGAYGVLVDTNIISWTNIRDPHHPNFADPAKEENPDDAAGRTGSFWRTDTTSGPIPPHCPSLTRSTNCHLVISHCLCRVRQVLAHEPTNVRRTC